MSIRRLIPLLAAAGIGTACFNYQTAYNNYCVGVCIDNTDGGNLPSPAPLCVPKTTLPSRLPTPDPMQWTAWAGAVDPSNQHLDFNGDGREEWLVVDDGIYAFRWVGLNAADEMTVFSQGMSGYPFPGGWMNGMDQTEVPGDFDGDGRGELLVHSPWGWGMLGWDPYGYPAALKLYPNDTQLPGGWTVQRGSVLKAADIDADGQQDLYVRSAAGMGILTSHSRGVLGTLAMAAEGSQIGEWTLQQSDEVLGILNLEGDCRAEILLRNEAGLALIGLAENNTLHVSRTSADIFQPYDQTGPRKTRDLVELEGGGRVDLDADGVWELVVQNPSTRRATVVGFDKGAWKTRAVFDLAGLVSATGNFDGTGPTQLLLIIPDIGWQIVKLSASGVPTTIADVAFDTDLGGWQLSPLDIVATHGRFARSDRSSLLIRKESTPSAAVIELAPNGSLRVVSRTQE